MATRAYWPMSISQRPSASENTDLIFPHCVDGNSLQCGKIKSVFSEAQQLVVIDEIGPMEIRSAMFRDTISEVLESGLPLLATIFARSLRFTDAIKMRPDVTLIEVRPDNRERLVFELSEILTTR